MVDENCDYILPAKNRLMSMTGELQALLTNCKDLAALNTAQSHIQAAITMLKALPTTTKKLPVKRKILPNSNNQKQLKFFSTKKPRLSVTKRISKPSNAQANEQRAFLRNVDPQVCGVCLKETDTKNSDIIDWMECSICDMWIHTSCTGITAIQDLYICAYCSQ